MATPAYTCGNQRRTNESLQDNRFGRRRMFQGISLIRRATLVTSGNKDRHTSWDSVNEFAKGQWARTIGQMPAGLAAGSNARDRLRTISSQSPTE